MKTVKIDEAYSIEIDSYNHTLVQNGINKKNGNPTKVFIGYFPTMEAVLRRVMKHKIIDKIDGEISLSQLLKVIEDTKKEIHDVCAELGI